VIGAGDVEKIAVWAKEALEQGRLSPAPEMPSVSGATTLRSNEPLARKTTLRVGGSADLWAEVDSVADLIALLQWARRQGIGLRIIGAGSNVLASDLGVRGVTARLAGKAFRQVREERGTVVAGAAVGLGALLDWAETRGLGGLEFLEGIPGTVGGAARMNAGAWGHAVAERVAWIRCLSADGAEHIVPSSAMEAGYRQCGALRSRMALEVAFAMTPDDGGAIRGRRRECAARREWMRGLRSAGSVFRNPPGDFAGRLLEAAGMKGARVGGAAVLERHANVIVTADGATASDVRALIEQMRDAVQERCGVRLETEIEFFE
jgi:UDP-N-acetylmuramate dehydrogenase